MVCDLYRIEFDICGRIRKHGGYFLIVKEFNYLLVIFAEIQLKDWTFYDN